MRGSPRPTSNQATSMSLQGARILTQHLAVHFARAGQGKLFETMDPRRPLVPSQPALFEESVELLLRQLADDERDRHFAELRVWASHDANIHHGWMRAYHRLDLIGVDVRSAPDDDVLDPADDVQISGLVDEAEVAHVRPAVCRQRTEVLAPVAALHEVAAHADFPFEDLPLGAIVRPPH